ncbi:MAG: type VI secretion system tip protein VgrG [Oleispira sp.]|nr:type VI secretion system tip protein VgrG [Oleispira sp.]MBL4881812.1 type VI secretion system tip protein VgrG [Oleispira sp.]
MSFLDNREIEIVASNSIGSFDNDLLLLEFNSDESLNSLFQHRLTTLCQNNDLDLKSLLGTTISVKVQGHHLIGAKYFHGHVMAISHRGWQGKFAKYEIELEPWLGFLDKTKDCRIFQNQSVVDIITSIFDENGFSDYKINLSDTYKPIEYCTQYRESDMNFINRLIEQEGIYYHFEQLEKKHIMVLSDSPSAHEVILGCQNLPFYPPGSVVRDENFIESWSNNVSVGSGSFALNAFDFEKPRAGLETNIAIAQKHDHADMEVYDYQHSYTKREDGTRYAKLRMEQLHCATQSFEGISNCPYLHAGGLFNITKHPVASNNGEYLLSKVYYYISTGQYETGDAQNVQMEVRFSCIPSQTQYRPPLYSQAPIIAGHQTAIVVGPKGEEIWTDEYGRVKLHFHWDRYSERNESSSCWVRVSQLWAGGNWGSVFTPRMGQEVIVDFIEGNPDKPMIVGRVYNADNMPPYKLPENQNQSGIKTRSTKGGSVETFNELRFDDTLGKETLTIHAEKDQNLSVENDESHFVGHDRTDEVVNDETIKIGHDRTEDVGNDEIVNVVHDRTQTVGNDENLTVDNNRTHTITTDETLSVGKNRKTDIVKNDTSNIGENYTMSVGKDEQRAVGDNRTTSIGKNETLDVGKKIIVQAGDEIVFKAGSAQITLSKNGDISIKGANITIEGSGNVILKGSKVQAN